MLKVLVVDDDSPIRRWLEYCIGQLEGFVLAGSAATGTQGLELYRRELPDIVVTDIEMPGMSGLDMVAQIQAIRPTHVIILTSHDNFSYARTALQNGTAEYILKTEVTLETMRDLLCKAARTIRHHGNSAVRLEQNSQMLLRQMAMEQGSTPPTVQQLRSQGITLEDAPLAAGDLWSRNGQNLQEACRRLEGCRAMTNVRFATVGYEHLLFVGNLRHSGGLEELAAFYRQQARELDCVLGLSETKPGVYELPQALQEAQARSRLHFYAPEQWVFIHEPVGRRTVHHAETARMNFSKELFARNYRGAASIKEDVMRHIREEHPTDLDSVKKLCASFCTILLHFVTERPEELDSRADQAEQAVMKAATMPELEAAVEAVFAPVGRSQPQGEACSPAIRDAIAYLQDHFREKITLGMVAQAVSFNPEYFSRLFARETGMNFSAFLNSLRMAQAVELLEHTDKKVYEIAEEVGYSSLSYFSTAFKKSFGQTPAEYQALKRKNNRDSAQDSMKQ